MTLTVTKANKAYLYYNYKPGDMVQIERLYDSELDCHLLFVNEEKSTLITEKTLIDAGNGINLSAPMMYLGMTDDRAKFLWNEQVISLLVNARYGSFNSSFRKDWRINKLNH